MFLENIIFDNKVYNYEVSEWVVVNGRSAHERPFHAMNVLIKSNYV